MHEALAGLTDEALRSMIVNEELTWPAAYEQLVIDRYGPVVASAVKWIGVARVGYQQAEDIHGDLLHHLRGRSGFWTPLRSWSPAKGRFHPWLWRVVVRLCYRTIKRRAGRNDKERSLDEPWEADTAITWEEQLADPATQGGAAEELQIWRSVLGDALQRLPPNQQAICWYYYFIGLPDREIGALLGQARETITRSRRGALRILQDTLNSDEGSVICLSDQ
jgi:RNA polymerase sigma factor (sigma-70 family)